MGIFSFPSFLTGLRSGFVKRSDQALKTSKPNTVEKKNPFAARTSFLFEDDVLIDATSSGRKLLQGLQSYGSEKQNLIRLCRTQYPELEECWDNTESLTAQKLTDTETGVCDLEISKTGNRVSIRFLDGPEYRDQTMQEEILAERVQELSFILNNSPDLIWKESAIGQLLWSNARYDTTLKQIKKSTAIGPLVSANRLFPDLNLPEPGSGQILTSQKNLTSPQNEELWFNVTSFPSNDGSIHFASNAGEAVEADRLQKSMLRSFVQVFAQLSIGFGIFDENQRLKLYNPALMELSGLSGKFLISQPKLENVIEEMRRIGKTPEPKDYGEFRQTIRNLEATHDGSNYEALWTLPDNQVLRITCRPYRSGSAVFLIEDVTREITLTRKYRAEVLAFQNVINAFDDPVFLFSSEEHLISTNGSARTLLGTSSGSLTTVADAISSQLKSVSHSNALQRFLSLKADQKLELKFKDKRNMQLSKFDCEGGYFCLRLAPSFVESTRLPKVALMSSDLH